MITLETGSQPVEISIVQDETILKEPTTDDDLLECGVAVAYHSGKGEVELILGNLRIAMTEKQEERIRYYYENT